jgi:hypothetical protein
LLSLGATRLPTDSTFSATRNGSGHFNDRCYYKGVDLSLLAQVKRHGDTTSDHDQLIVKCTNVSKSKGKIRYFSEKLRDDPELLARWQQTIVELND